MDERTLLVSEMTLRTVVRECIKFLSEGSTERAENVTVMLKQAGAVRNIHLGRKDLIEGSDEAVEWYAGQIIDVLESEKWFAVNSLINCVDRFAPEVKR